MSKQNDAQASNGMVDLVVKSTFGNFDYVAVTKIPQATLVAAGCRGFLWELQRSPAGAAETAITGFDGKTPATTKPDAWTRTDIPFTAANAEVIRKALSDRSNFAKGSFLPSDAKVEVTVTEHVTTVAEPKYTQERAYVKMTLQFEGIEALRKTAKKAGYTGSDAQLKDENNFELFAKIAAYRAATVKSL